MQDAASAEPARPEPADPTRPPRTDHPRWRRLLVLVVAVAASAGFYGSVIYPQPAIALTGFSYVASACSRLGNSSQENYTYSVTLTNTGPADGSSLVWFYMDGSFVVYYSRYSVPHGTTQRILYTEDWPDCNPHVPSAAISDVAKTW